MNAKEADYEFKLKKNCTQQMNNCRDDEKKVKRPFEISNS